MGRHRRRSGGVVTRRRLLLALGAGLSGAGLTSTGAYSSVKGSRETTIGVASDTNGYLGLAGYAEATTTPTLTNNSGKSMSITLSGPAGVEFDVGTDGNWTGPSVTVSLAAGASVGVAIRTGGCSGTSVSVATTAELLEGGTAVGTIDLTRTWAIPQSGQIQVTANVTSSGASGKYEFELENTGCVDVTIDGLGVNETTTSATEVSGGAILTTSSGTQVVSDPIPIDSTSPDSAAVRGFAPDVTLPTGTTETFQFDRFQDPSGTGGGGNPGNGNGNGSGNAKVDMRGEDVRVTVTFTDGSAATLKLCDGPCNF